MATRTKKKQLSKIPPFISQREFARRLKLKSHTAVTQAMDNGRIKKGIYIHKGVRKILFEIAKKEFESTADPKYNKSKKNGQGRNLKPDTKDKRGGGESDTSTLIEIKKDQATIDLELNNIKLARIKGELVLKSEVFKVLFEFGKNFRDQLTVIPDRIADNLFAAESRNQIHIILTEAIEDALRNLANTEKLDFTDNKKKGK